MPATQLACFLHRHTIAVACSVFLVGSIAHETQASTWDLTSDFNTSNNPDGPWAYRAGNGFLAFTPDWFAIPGSVQPAWSNQTLQINPLPGFARAQMDNPEGLDLLNGDVFVHSMDTFRGPGEIANITWTSPINGTIDVEGAIWALRDIGRSNVWEMLLNGSPLTDGLVGSGDPYDRGNPFMFSGGTGGPMALSGLSVVAGDMLQLNIISTAIIPGDFAGLRMTVTESNVSAVPIPATLPFLAVALATLAAVRKRKSTLPA